MVKLLGQLLFQRVVLVLGLEEIIIWSVSFLGRTLIVGLALFLWSGRRNEFR